MAELEEDSDLTALVSEALELRDRGLELEYERICEQRPDLIEAVRESVEASERLASLQVTSSGLDDYEGQVLAKRYRLQGRMGAGAMGVVYRAEDLELHRSVAVKILRLGLLGGEEAEFRFAREAEVLAALDHPSIVTVYDRGRTASDDPYLVMELLDGEPLHRVLEEGKLAGVTTQTGDTAWVAKLLGRASLEEPSYLRATVRWTADLASGLASAHESGIYHRDVKPSNIFLRGDGRPVLLDFGIAARASQATFTREGLIGTPAYMAPETLAEGTGANPQLDVYGLTATLYHLLTLHAPYVGTPSQIITTLLTRDVRRVRAASGMPRDLQAILDMGMARRPADRYSSASELEEDLRAFLDYKPVRARHVTFAQRGWRKLRRSSEFKVGAVLILLVLAVLGFAEGREVWRARRADRLFEIVKHLPPNLTLNGAEFRRMAETEGPEQVEALLDAAVDVALSPLPVRLTRACFRLDHGRAALAARDMEAIASAYGTPFLRELAQRYAALPADAAGSDALDREGLPEPSTGMDRYVAAIHEFRDGRIAEAFELLRAPELEEFLPAQELLILSLAKADTLHEMHEKAVWLEQRQGGRTATSAHRLGTALLLLNREDRALGVLQDGARLAPNSFVLEENVALTAYDLGFLELAREHIERAIELKPNSPKPYLLLIRVLIALPDREAAVAAANAAPFSDRIRATQLGKIETEEALALRAEGQLEESAVAAQRAVLEFARAEELGLAPESVHATIAQALVDEDEDPVFTGLLGVLQQNPLHRRRLQLLPQWMPGDLSADQTRDLARFLERLVAEIDVLQGSQSLHE